MSRLTQNTCINLAKKLGTYTTNPPRMSEVKAALYGNQGRSTDEISYLGKNKSKLSDAWVTKTNNKTTLNEVRNVFMLSSAF